MGEYGENSVLSAILSLHAALEMNYMRTGMAIRLEPDAFYRLTLELKGKDKFNPISEEIKKLGKISINTPAGPLDIFKDESLGKDGYDFVRYSNQE